MKRSGSRIKLSLGEHTFYLANNLVMALLIMITLYPMLYVLFCSFSSPSELVKVDGLLLSPAGFTTRGYEAVFRSTNIWLGFRNTLFYVVVGTALSMVLTILGGYALSRKGYMLKKPIFILIMITMFFSGGMVPSYLLVRRLGLVNTVWAMVVPGALNTYNMIVLRTSFQSVPESLLESAYLDGAGEFTILWRIVLPVSLPALATITLFYAVGLWSAWYGALVYLQGQRELYPLQMFLRELLVTGDFKDPNFVSTLQGDSDQYLLNEVIKYATIIVSTVPILLVYPFLQKYFVKGVLVGSIKG